MNTKKIKKHFFFDVDGTLTESRQLITNEVCGYLGFLIKTGKDVVAISGAAKDQMLKQLNGCEVNYVLAQSGNDSPFWQKLFTEKDKKEVLRHIEQIKIFFEGKNIIGTNKEDLLQDRGSQMSFSFLGHNSDVRKKKAFDPRGDFRREVLKNVPFESDALECRIGGTTCLDYTYKGYTKGKNIEKLIEKVGWQKDECIYFGDALFENGNDETVLGIIDTVEVTDPRDLVKKLKEIFKKDGK